MKLTVSKSVLAKQVTKALAFVERKSTIPILATFHVSAEESDQSVTIRATDLEISLVAEFDAAVSERGQTTIPARKLSDVLKKLQGIELTRRCCTVSRSMGHCTPHG